MTVVTGSPSRIGILWDHARPHLPTLVFGLVLALAGSAMELASPLVTKWVLDTVAEGGSLSGPVLLLLALLVVGAGVTWWQWVVLGTLAERIVYDARENMIVRYLRAKVLPLLARPAGEMVTRVTSDTVLLREAASSSLVGLLNGAVMLVGSLVLMTVLDPMLALVTFGATALVVVLFSVLLPAIATAQQRAQGALGDLGGSLDGTLRAVRTVKAAGVEDAARDRLLTHAADARRFGVRAVRREALVWTVAWSGLQAAIVLILGVGAWRVAGGEMTVSTLVAFLLYAFGLMGPIMELSQNLSTLQSGIAAAGRIREVRELESEPVAAGARPAPEPGRPGPAPAGAVELRGVDARYPGAAEPAVRGLDLVVPERGHVAVVGPSGAGKTTLLSLLLRFVDPERGELLLGGVPYIELDVHQVRSRFAYVEQETPVVPGTIRDNLTLAAPDVSDERIAEVLRSIHLDGVVADLELGLDTPLSDSSVSGGQRQRIALARALLAEPPVLLLDEATAQVDGITEAAIQTVLRAQARRGAVVTVAHRLSTVLDADEIVVMDSSRVVARGTHVELLGSSALYRDLVEALRIRTDVVPVG
ncbi:ABC transporter ATP-binding protein [Pseudonocardia sp. NPDC046786]|uniref:ABC transporter ATP-binding protein n=1 Tax=Pseudonocardia sp. NPDC046786 TaxID=3155471 RepID=UPI0033EE21D0